MGEATEGQGGEREVDFVNMEIVCTLPGFPQDWYYKKQLEEGELLMKADWKCSLWAHPVRFLYLSACINF